MNAFNGANFDHYYIFQTFMKFNKKPKKHIINNGSVISFEYDYIRLLDVCKHLQGGLKDNLESFKCNIKKGDYDHDKSKKWDTMDKETQDNCLEYLEADVLGLKELYEKLNEGIFKK